MRLYRLEDRYRPGMAFTDPVGFERVLLHAAAEHDADVRARADALAVDESCDRWPSPDTVAIYRVA